MGKKKKKEIQQKNEGLNVVWFISAAVVVGFLFFSIRSWLKGPPHEQYVAPHLRKKIKVKTYKNVGKYKRDVKGYNVRY